MELLSRVADYEIDTPFSDGLDLRSRNSSGPLACLGADLILY